MTFRPGCKSVVTRVGAFGPLQTFSSICRSFSAHLRVDSVRWIFVKNRRFQSKMAYFDPKPVKMGDFAKIWQSKLTLKLGKNYLRVLKINCKASKPRNHTFAPGSQSKRILTLEPHYFLVIRDCVVIDSSLNSLTSTPPSVTVDAAISDVYTNTWIVTIDFYSYWFFSCTVTVHKFRVAVLHHAVTVPEWWVRFWRCTSMSIHKVTHIPNQRSAYSG